jgi:hypothetical protein
METQKTLLTVVITVVVTLLVVVGGYFGFKALNKPKIQADQAEVKKEVVIPDNFVKVDLNGAKVYYPKAWGTPKTEVTKEDLSTDLGPGITFKGEFSRFDTAGAYVAVNNYSSYLNKDFSKEIVQYLRKVYGEKKINPEDVLSLPQKGYLPVVNAGVFAYNPRYIESKNGEWRGYWYLSHITQGYDSSIKFVSVMYSLTKGKVVTISQDIKTSKTEQLGTELKSTATEKLNEWWNKNETYALSAYTKDEEVSLQVNQKLLPVCDTIQ